MKAPTSPAPSRSDSDPTGGPTNRERIRAALSEALALVRRLGAGAVQLYRRIRNVRTPSEMLSTIDQNIAANEARATELAGRIEQLHGVIVEKKKAWSAASPARRALLEAELKTLMAQYSSTEREYRVLLENQRILAQVRGRIHEAMAYGMSGVTESDIDEWADIIEEHAADAEARVDAARDLERAGRRRESAAEQESFLEQLARFDMPEDSRPEPPWPDIHPVRPSIPSGSTDPTQADPRSDQPPIVHRKTQDAAPEDTPSS